MPTAAETATELIAVRGAATHNLQDVDLDLPRNRLIVFCGASGSGKTSMAIDTLYAEGQRRYIESFSAYTRQFLEQLDKPDVERIDGLPPAIAVTRSSGGRSNRATVATVTEVADHLRLLFARIGRIVCPDCDEPVRNDTIESIADRVLATPDGERVMLGFEVDVPEEGAAARIAEFVESGFVRAVVDGETVELADLAREPNPGATIAVVTDRLVGGRMEAARVAESVETAVMAGDGACVLIGAAAPGADASGSPEPLRFTTALRCNGCGREFTPPSPQLFNFNSPLGACEQCEGFGSVVETDMDLVVPDKSKSLRQGAVAPWTTPAYEHELEELLALADDYGLPVDVPFAELTDEQVRLIIEGVPERDFGGLNGFIRWLERRKYKMHLRVFLSRWRSYRPCDGCRGARLRPEALAVRVGGKNFAEVTAMEVREAAAWFDALDPPDPIGERLEEGANRSVHSDNPVVKDTVSSPTTSAEGGTSYSSEVEGSVKPSATGELSRTERVAPSPSPSPLRGGEDCGLSGGDRAIAGAILADVRSRLGYLEQVGVGYLTLDRSLRTLSSGETQRVTMTTTLGSNLVDMLYVLDEPSTGLHPVDVAALTSAITRLRDRGNTVVVVDHEEETLRAADELVEFGPLAGVEGGEVVFQGPPEAMIECRASRTGDWLAGRRAIRSDASTRREKSGVLQLLGASGANLGGPDGPLDVDFPLGVLTVVTGPSGAGKSSLVRRTLYPALTKLVAGGKNGDGRHEEDRPLPYTDLLGARQIDEVVLVDQQPIGRSPRSNPVTYIKAFDPIRAAFAELPDAKARGYTASHFSFNVDGGRCEACQGAGMVEIDMQFLADIYMTCRECDGARYKREVLDIKLRGRDIAEVLQMTASEAFRFFRGQPKVQAKLKTLIDVGLDYLQLGQPAGALSGGEAQRLKLAGLLSTKQAARTLFVMDEPTTGLHFSDVEQLIDCFGALLDVGHSLVVIEHNVPMMMAADWILDLGPGASADGGRVVVEGTPETVAACGASATGRVLAEAFARRDAALAELEADEAAMGEE